MHAEMFNHPDKGREEWAFMYVTALMTGVNKGVELCSCSAFCLASSIFVNWGSTSVRCVSWFVISSRPCRSSHWQILKTESHFLPQQQLQCHRHCCHLSCITWPPDKGGLSGYLAVSRQLGHFLATAKAWRLGVGCMVVSAPHGCPPWLDRMTSFNMTRQRTECWVK